MATELTMPRLSESMEEGTILKWLVEEGGELRQGEPLVEIETDKSNMTYDAETDGKLVEILAREGDTLAVGAPIARIDGGDDEADPGGEEAADSGGEAAADPGDDDEAAEPESAIAASPVAQRMAQAKGVDLAAVEGSGPGGRVTKDDVEEAAGAGKRVAAARGAVELHDLSRLQQNLSRRMAESKATAPDYTLVVDVDMTVAVQLRERLRDASEHPPSLNDMVVKAVANVLREHPKVNGAYRDGKFELYERVNVGITVAAKDAFVVPTIFDADQKSLGQIARDAHELAEKVRDGKITSPELAGGTFTISNLGMYGIDEFTAVINPPQAAILTVGAVKKRPAVDDNGRIVAREQMRLGLVSDSRILYGADAAAFLADVRELLEQPLNLAL